MPTILIGCKLPHGVKFKGSDGEYIVINGMNTSLIADAPGLTHIDESEWSRFVATHEDFQPLISQAIFTFGTNKVADIAAMTNELASERTGFEGLNPEKPAPNLVPENPKALKEALNDKRANRTHVPKTKADKAAALELASSLGEQ